MDYSAANTGLWTFVIQFGMLAGILLLANVLSRKVKLVRKAMIPTSVLGGFIALLFRSLGILPMDGTFLEYITYHAIAIGFIALSLRVPKKYAEKDKKIWQDLRVVPLLLVPILYKAY